MREKQANTDCFTSLALLLLIKTFLDDLFKVFNVLAAVLVASAFQGCLEQYFSAVVITAD